MTFGQKLKYYREKQKMGQESLAELSHISVSTIRKYESDERKPKKEQVESVALALHISPAALMDYSIDNSVDVYPWLYSIGEWGNIRFTGEKDSEGKYIKDTISIKFDNPDLMDFIKDWADKKEELESVKTASALIKDEATKKMMEQRINDLSSELENTLVMDRISKSIYFEEELPKNYPSNKIKKDTPKLNKYSDMLNVLTDIARSSIKLECVGVFERVWDAKAIFTFDASTLDLEKMSQYAEDCYAKFLYYYDEFAKLGIKTEGYAFVQGGVKYYRYIIKDRTLASALYIINKLLENKDKELDEYERQEVDEYVEENIRMYNVPVEVSR